MVQVILGNFSPIERQRLAKIVLHCVSKGEGDTERDDLKKAFEIAKKLLNKPTPQICQYVWQEHLRNYYRSVYEKALQKGSKNRTMRKELRSDEENRYFVSLMCTELLKGLTISQALKSVSEIVNLKESTVKTKWYSLMRKEEYKEQFELALKNKPGYQGYESSKEDSEMKQEGNPENTEITTDDSFPDEALLVDSLTQFIASYKTMKTDYEIIKTQNKSLQEKCDKMSSELEKLKTAIKSLTMTF